MGAGGLSDEPSVFDDMRLPIISADPCLRRRRARPIGDWSWTSATETLIKIAANILRRYVTFLIAEIVIIVDIVDNQSYRSPGVEGHRRQCCGFVWIERSSAGASKKMSTGRTP